MILVTNDDGVESAGMKVLATALETLDSVYVVAPDRERSAVGMAITLHHPLRAKQVGDRFYAVDGTPVDCVDLAIAQLLPESPKLVVSGINHGDNLGHDLHFSGTVAAARKAALLHIPAIAFSMTSSRKYHYETALKYAVQIVERVADQGIPDGILLNVNIPNLEVSDVQGVKVTRQDLGTYSANAIERKDRTGNPYYWIGGDRLATDQRPDTDLNTLKNRFVSITPVQLDQTAYDHLDMVKDWFNC